MTPHPKPVWREYTVKKNSRGWQIALHGDGKLSIHPRDISDFRGYITSLRPLTQRRVRKHFLEEIRKVCEKQDYVHPDDVYLDPEGEFFPSRSAPPRRKR